MNIIESVKRRELDNLVRLTCGHEIITTNPNVRAGFAYACPECPAERLTGVRTATEAELLAVVETYAEIMRARGHTIGKQELTLIARMAGIQDAWRVAFKRVLG